MAKYYPVNLVLENKKCVVIGAGIIAERKIKRLLECGARVLVVSPETTAGIKRLSATGKIILKNRKARINDLNKAYLVIAASSDREFNAAVSAYCHQQGILVNIVDSPRECNFILPSLVRRGALTISISTNGISPALSKKIRQDLESKFGSEYTKLLNLLKKIRPQALKGIKSPKLRKLFFQEIFQPEVLMLLKQNKESAVRRKINTYLKNANG